MASSVAGLSREILAQIAMARAGVSLATTTEIVHADDFLDVPSNVVGARLRVAYWSIIASRILDGEGRTDASWEALYFGEEQYRTALAMAATPFSGRGAGGIDAELATGVDTLRRLGAPQVAAILNEQRDSAAIAAKREREGKGSGSLLPVVVGATGVAALFLALAGWFVGRRR